MNCIGGQIVLSLSQLCDTQAGGEVVSEVTKDVCSGVDIEADSAKEEPLYFTTDVNSMLHEVRKEISCGGEAMQLSQSSGAKPCFDKTKSDNTEKDGTSEDEPNNQFSEVNNNTVTEQLMTDRTRNRDDNEAREIGIPPDAGLLTRKCVIEDHRDELSKNAAHSKTLNVINDVPTTTSTIGRRLSYSRCYGGSLQPGITAQEDRTGIVAETDALPDGGTDPTLQPNSNCLDQEDVFPSAFATAFSGEELYIKITCELQPQSSPLQLSVNGVAADTVNLCEDKCDECFNNNLQPEPVMDNSCVTDETNIGVKCFHCIPLCGETLLTKEEQTTDTQTSDFYLTPMADEYLPKECVDLKYEAETRMLSKEEVFEMEQESQIDLEVCCVEVEEKMDEIPATKVNVLEVDQQFMEGLSNSSVQSESGIKERPAHKAEVVEMSKQSVVDQEMFCVGSNGEMEERPDSIFEVDQQLVVHLKMPYDESENKTEEVTVKKLDVFEIDQQIVVNLKSSSIESDSKTEEIAVNKPDAFEVSQQSVGDLDISFESEDKIEEKPANKVFEKEISCVDSEDQMEERSVSNVQVFPFDHQSMADLECVEHDVNVTIDIVKSQQQNYIEETIPTDTNTNDGRQECPENKEYRHKYVNESCSLSSKPHVLVTDQIENVTHETSYGGKVMVQIVSMDQAYIPCNPKGSDLVVGEIGMCMKDDDMLKEPHRLGETSEAVPSPTAIPHGTNSQHGATHGEDTSVLQNIDGNRDETLTPLMECEIRQPAHTDDETEKQQDKTATVMELNSTSGNDYADLLLTDADTALDPMQSYVSRNTTMKEYAQDKHFNTVTQDSGTDLSTLPTTMLPNGDLAVNKAMDIVAKQEDQTLSAQHIHLSTMSTVQQVESRGQISSGVLINTIDEESTVLMEVCGQDGACNITFAREQQYNATTSTDIHRFEKTVAMLSASDENAISEDKDFNKQKGVTQEPTEHVNNVSAGKMQVPVSYSGPSSATILKEDTHEGTCVHTELQDRHHSMTAENSHNPLVEKQETNIVYKKNPTGDSTEPETYLVYKNPTDGSIELQLPSLLEPSDDDMHQKSVLEDPYTKIKSCIHTTVCNSKLVVQFASPLASFIEYSNEESSCSSEDTQDAIETMMYLNNDAIYSEHDFTFSTVPKPWGFEDDQLRYAGGSVSDTSKSIEMSGLNSNVDSKQELSGYSVNSSGVIGMIEESEHEVPVPSGCLDTDTVEDKCFSAVSLNCEHKKRKEIGVGLESAIPNKLQKLAAGEDISHCHVEPATKLQESDGGQHSSWKKETSTVVEDQQVPNDEAFLQQEVSLYGETSSQCAKQSNSESSFHWRYAPSIGSPVLLAGSAAAADYDPGDSRLPMLKTCNKPRRVGLSRRAHVCSLHPYFKSKSKAQFS
ncbi:hypothetical protein LSAT2_010196 [Lamellibrachia satsuma]|nr:hypothetical protein LSAT2_010196 [Lamellibrachia satsuma]